MPKPVEINYALAIDGAVMFVARALDKAAPAALSVSALAESYKHGIGGDLARVMRHEGAADRDEAKLWIVNRAIQCLGDGVESDGATVTFANGHVFEDLRFNGKKLTRAEPDIHAQFGDLFNPMSGAFSDNIREKLHGGKADTAYTELRESLQTHGWVDEFPALVDERGTVLVGNRRMALAKELGITPVVKTLVLGRGDASDAVRLRLAIVSNIARKDLSPSDRKRIAEVMYKDGGWSQKRIAEALSVSQQRISEDLRELPDSGNSYKHRGGRPRSKSAGEKAPKADPNQAERDATDAAVKEHRENGCSHKDIRERLGISRGKLDRSITRILERERALENSAPQVSAPIVIAAPQPSAPQPSAPAPQTTAYDLLRQAWQKASPEERKRFWNEVSKEEGY